VNAGNLQGAAAHMMQSHGGPDLYARRDAEIQMLLGRPQVPPWSH
jgi:hypothetical protein